MANHTKVSAAEKLIDLKVAAEEKLAKAEARLNEKVILTKANLALGLHRIIHHEHSQRHDRCLDSAAEIMTAASDKRLRKEQEATEKAEWERAMAREWSAYKSSRHMEHHNSHSHKHLKDDNLLEHHNSHSHKHLEDDNLLEHHNSHSHKHLKNDNLLEDHLMQGSA